MAALLERIMNASRYCANRATLFHGAFSRDKRPGTSLCLNYNHSAGKTTDDTIATWEVHGIGRDTRRELRQERAALLIHDSTGDLLLLLNANDS